MPPAPTGGSQPNLYKVMQRSLEKGDEGIPAQSAAKIMSSLVQRQSERQAIFKSILSPQAGSRRG